MIPSSNINSYHITWIEDALNNIKNSEQSKVIYGGMTIEEFIEKYDPESFRKVIKGMG